MSKQAIAIERQRINDSIRSFFRARGFTEVETPIIVASPGMEPNLQPFETDIIEPDGKRHQAGLITSPEYAMKKLLGQGLEKIFTITKVFRNGEELGGNHYPEFSLLEWYGPGDYQDCMDETEALIKEVAKGFEKDIDTFDRKRMVDLFNGHGLDLQKLEKKGDDTESDAFHRAFLDHIEPNLGSTPIFVHDYPVYQAALARLTEDKQYGERFELYMNGLELCNGFTELTDSREQRKRFEEEAEERKALEKTVFPIDEELLRLLPSIPSPTYGNALGIDRLHMAVTDRKRIQDVTLFDYALTK